MHTQCAPMVGSGAEVFKKYYDIEHPGAPNFFST